MTEPTCISKSELARRLNLPESEIWKATKAGRLKPDFVIGRAHAFRMERIPEIVQTLATTIEH